MNIFKMRFPNGLAKVLTFSYDDGAVQDNRLVDIFDKYGMKATFNLNSGLMGEDQNINGRLTYKQALDLFANSPHEVALHGCRHPRLETMPIELAAREILEDRKNLEGLFKRPITGLAYPLGGVTDSVIKMLKRCGISYGRTVAQTLKFNVPRDTDDWYLFEPTCHHNNSKLFELADEFIAATPDHYPYLFFIWGHSSDFAIDNNWERIEEFCQKMCGKDDIWYATNIEIYNYFDAYNNLIFSSACTRVYNPSAIPVWFQIDKKIYRVNPDETLEIN